ATRRMMTDVQKADLVAMNPSHYAVALRYDAKTMKAPRVVAKGADLVAFEIRRVAEAHKVPIFEHPQFARALYFTSDIGKEVSPRLYVAVAQVLTYIYQLTGRSAPGTSPRAAHGNGKGNGKGKGKPKLPVLTIDPELSEPRPPGMAEVPRMQDAIRGRPPGTGANPGRGPQSGVEA
ncbi:MAG: type III secretion system protein, partial [Lysobacterales bacterium]